MRTRVVSSEEDRSAMERRWRGANGEVGGVEGVEKGLLSFLRARKARIVGSAKGILGRHVSFSHCKYWDIIRQCCSYANSLLEFMQASSVVIAAGSNSCAAIKRRLL